MRNQIKKRRSLGKAKPLYLVDNIVRTVASALAEDLLPQADIGCTILGAALQQGDVSGIRASGDAYEPDLEANSWTVKSSLQLKSLLKKYTFETDVYTDQQVDEMSKNKFVDNQLRMAAISHNPPTGLTASVSGFARGWLLRVLGDYDTLEHLEACSFGKKSSVGIPMRLACEGERLELPITGSPEHITWFEHVYLTAHPQMRKYLDDLCSAQPGQQRYRVVDRLSAVLVPKTFKVRRLIVPQPTIGTNYTGGLGKVLESRLRGAGYDIRVLQEEHRRLACEASSTGEYVTADQSLASDNITWARHINHLFPRRWADALNLGRVLRLDFGGEEVLNDTFAGMGVGFTFPLQTLLFLSLLKGIAAHAGRHDAAVSVYGDDLIYETWMHADVVRVFCDLGLQINEDKTFSTGSFRESCGGDYHRGLDVRPWMIPEAPGHTLSPRKCEAFLYKLVNGLRRRWADEDAPRTLKCLSDWLKLVAPKGVYVVPADFPDTTGVKVRSRRELPQWLPTSRVPSVNMHGTATFAYLAFRPAKREETRHAPYLWRRLQESAGAIPLFSITRKRRVLLVSIRDSDMPDIFTEEKVNDVWTSSPAASRHRDDVVDSHLCVTTIPDGDRGRYIEQTASTAWWT